MCGVSESGDSALPDTDPVRDKTLDPVPSPCGKDECGPRDTFGFFLEARTFLFPSFTILVWPCKQQDLGGAATEKRTESKI